MSYTTKVVAPYIGIGFVAMMIFVQISLCERFRQDLFLQFLLLGLALHNSNRVEWCTNLVLGTVVVISPLLAATTAIGIVYFFETVIFRGGQRSSLVVIVPFLILAIGLASFIWLLRCSSFCRRR